jgi:hypothetical protein
MGSDQYDEKHIEKRREAALQKMLATPPKPFTPKAKKKPSPTKPKAKKAK